MAIGLESSGNGGIEDVTPQTTPEQRDLAKAVIKNVTALNPDKKPEEVDRMAATVITAVLGLLFLGNKK